MLERLTASLEREWAELARAAGAAPRVAGEPANEGALIERASEGAAARGFLESPIVQGFMAKVEARLTTELVGLPLSDDDGRRRLAEAVQTTRQLQKFLAASASDGRSAERELERLRKGDKGYF